MCDGSEIKKGRWKGKKTPDLTDVFLMGDRADSENIKLFNHVTPAETFDARLNIQISESKKKTTAGFCFHKSPKTSSGIKKVSKIRF